MNGHSQLFLESHKKKRSKMCKKPPSSFLVFQPSTSGKSPKITMEIPEKMHLRHHLCRAPKPAAALDLPLGGRQLGLRKVSEQIHHGISRIFYDFFKDFDVFSMNLHGFH